MTMPLAMHNRMKLSAACDLKPCQEDFENRDVCRQRILLKNQMMVELRGEYAVLEDNPSVMRMLELSNRQLDPVNPTAEIDSSILANAQVDEFVLQTELERAMNWFEAYNSSRILITHTPGLRWEEIRGALAEKSEAYMRVIEQVVICTQDV